MKFDNLPCEARQLDRTRKTKFGRIKLLNITGLMYGQAGLQLRPQVPSICELVSSDPGSGDTCDRTWFKLNKTNLKTGVEESTVIQKHELHDHDLSRFLTHVVGDLLLTRCYRVFRIAGFDTSFI